MFLQVLLGGAIPPPDSFANPRPLKETQAALHATVAAQAPFWCDSIFPFASAVAQSAAALDV